MIGCFQSALFLILPVSKVLLIVKVSYTYRNLGTVALGSGHLQDRKVGAKRVELGSMFVGSMFTSQWPCLALIVSCPSFIPPLWKSPRRPSLLSLGSDESGMIDASLLYINVMAWPGLTSGSNHSFSAKLSRTICHYSTLRFWIPAPDSVPLP